MSKLSKRLEYFINKLYWNLHSRTWDDYLDSTNYSSEINEIVEIIQEYSSNEADSILDLGCATGTYAIELAKKGFCVTGLDYAASMIERAKLKAEHQNLRNVEFIVADFNNKLPYDDNKFDFVLTAHTFRATENKTSFFNEIRRVLKKNGKLIVVLKNKKVRDGETKSKQRGFLAILLKRIKHLLFNKAVKSKYNELEFSIMIIDLGYSILAKKNTSYNSIFVLQ